VKDTTREMIEKGIAVAWLLYMVLAWSPILGWW
jgi:hypothetical protein